MANILRIHQRETTSNKLSKQPDTAYSKALIMVNRAIKRYKKDKAKRRVIASRHILISNTNYWILYEVFLQHGGCGSLRIDGFNVVGSFQLSDSDCYTCYY